MMRVRTESRNQGILISSIEFDLKPQSFGDLLKYIKQAFRNGWSITFSKVIK